MISIHQGKTPLILNMCYSTLSLGQEKILVGARLDYRVEIIHLYIVSVAVKREVEIYVRLRSVDLIYS